MFKITLRDARELSGFTIEDITNHCGLTEDEYQTIEEDPSQTCLSLVLKITTFLGLQLSLIHPGNKVDCIYHNRLESIT
jgi:DNA-binding XRE family transcriptional regulator